MSCGLLGLTMTATSAAAQYRPRPVIESPASEAFVIEGMVGLWSPSTQLTLSSEGLGIIGTNIDLGRDLGLTTGRHMDLRVMVRPARKHKFRFQYVPMGYSQTKSVDRDLVFNGQRFATGTTVTSQLDWKATRISYEYDFLSMARGFGGLVLDLKQTNVRAALESAATAEFTQLRASVPAVGGIARVYITPHISVTGELSGMRLPSGAVEESRGHYVEVDIFGTLNISPRVAAQVGYRALDVETRIDDDAAAFTLRGLYFGVVVRR